MRDKHTEDLTMQRKVKVIKKLYCLGCKSEKALLTLSMMDILSIENISIQDIVIILAIQKHVKHHTLFSYLCGTEGNETAEVPSADKCT